MTTFYSPFSGLELIIRPERPVYNSAGDQIDSIRELKAEFAFHRGEYKYLDANGTQQEGADIVGHFFDLEAQAEEKEWTPEEIELAKQRLEFFCKKFPDQVRPFSKAPAAKPWPKYDEAPHGSIAQLAEALGLVHESLLYERENKNRKTVVDALESLIEPDVQEDADVELTAA